MPSLFLYRFPSPSAPPSCLSSPLTCHRQALPVAVAERAGRRMAGGSGAGAGGGRELDFSDGYTAHRSTSSGAPQVTRHNVVSVTVTVGIGG